ncbi:MULTISPECIES: DUF7848 domain-containing protein [Streptomyces]|uniref:DUF7848 domain-containing protein n=1 Tax=Streptomyces lonegramiae TaxID=3075524 RepID=A0ABU2XBP1_9ACTN|nr:hypothetical protein [Streptomyces sp. DSM 41529]MDT0543331.1 hypothetical protein [Streptomyces sp. DSM 41529]
MTRTIMRGSDLVLSAERAQGAPDGIYLAECMACPATSGRVDSNPGPVARWAILHAQQQGLNHGQFLVTVERHWRVDPVRTPNARGTVTLPPTHSAGATNRTPATHRAPRRWGTCWRRTVACLGRCAGPLVLTTFFLGAALGGYLIGTGQNTG